MSLSCLGKNDQVYLPWWTLVTSRRDHITIGEVLKRPGRDTLHDIVKCRRQRLSGHSLRLPRHRTQHIVMDWVPEVGSRKRGRPTKTYRTVCICNFEWR